VATVGQKHGSRLQARRKSVGEPGASPTVGASRTGWHRGGPEHLSICFREASRRSMLRRRTWAF